PEKGFENDLSAMRKITETLQTARPDIVYVALGSPKQELVIDRIRRLLPQTWWLGVGVSFSFLCGEVKRAPQWMRKSGLEWLHRMAQEPRRLTKRYLLVGIPFAGTMLARSSLRGIPNRLWRKNRRVDSGEESAATVNEIATQLEAQANSAEAEDQSAEANITSEPAGVRES